MKATHLSSSVTSDLLRLLEGRIKVADGRESITVVAPYTGDAIGEVPQAVAKDVDRAVAASREAQKSWSKLSLTTRRRIFYRFHDLLLDHTDMAMDLIQLEAGKSRQSAYPEVVDVVATARFYANTAPGLLEPKRRAVSLPGTTTTFQNRHPLGVVGFIVPWNFPFTLGISDAIPALLAGNGAVIKPDEKTPYSTLFAVDLLEQAGLPEGLVQVVTGDGAVVGPPLIDSVDFIMFTGSTEVGRQVAAQAGQRLIGSSMELGGKNPAIVAADADLDVTVDGLIRSVFANGGQLCLASERIYVEEPILNDFQTRFLGAVNELELSTKFEFAGPMSSMITPEHLENVHRHVEDAVAKGATLLAGGKPRPDIGPAFFEPTVLTNVDESMLLCREETFGPVVSIYPVPDIDAAIEMANDSDYGLNASVWTRDTKRGRAIATQIKAGTVGVNDGFTASWSSYDSPMGGMRASGLSRRHGEEGLLKYTDSQTVAVQRWIPSFAPPRGMSYERYMRVLFGALRLARRLPFYK